MGARRPHAPAVWCLHGGHGRLHAGAVLGRRRLSRGARQKTPRVDGSSNIGQKQLKTLPSRRPVSVASGGRARGLLGRHRPEADRPAAHGLARAAWDPVPDAPVGPTCGTWGPVTRPATHVHRPLPSVWTSLLTTPPTSTWTLPLTATCVYVVATPCEHSGCRVGAKPAGGNATWHRSTSCAAKSDFATLLTRVW